MAPAQRFHVGPFERLAVERSAEHANGVAELLPDAQWLALAIEYGASWQMNERTPAVVFGLPLPDAVFRQRLFYRPAIDRASRVGDRGHLRPFVFTIAMIGTT